MDARDKARIEANLAAKGIAPAKPKPKAKKKKAEKKPESED